MALKIGLVGAGSMAQYHIAGYRRAGAEIAAVADRCGERGRALARELGAAYFPDLTLMLASGKADAVAILAPNRFHAPMTLEALAAGVHVFCEKPPAVTAAEAVAMRDAARRSGRILMFNLNNRARADVRAIVDFLKQGKAGRVNSAQAVWMRRTGIPGFGGWFTNRELAGGGPLIDLLHMIDLALCFLGEPEPDCVLAQTFDDFISNPDFKGPWGVAQPGGVTDVENACHGFVRFRTGQVLTLRCSWAEMIRSEEVSVAFQGTKAGGMLRRTFEVDGDESTTEDLCELYWQRGAEPVNREIEFVKDESMGRVESAENFIRVLKGEDEPLNTPDDAVRLMKIIDAAYRSAAAGAPVFVERT